MLREERLAQVAGNRGANVLRHPVRPESPANLVSLEGVLLGAASVLHELAAQFRVVSLEKEVVGVTSATAQALAGGL